MNRTTTDTVFNELRDAAIEIWHNYDDSYGYVTNKVAYVNSIKNFKDNYGTLIGMFDSDNQRKLWLLVGDEGKDLIEDWTGGVPM